MDKHYPCPSCKELVKVGHPQKNTSTGFIDLIGYCPFCHLQFEITFEQMEKYQRENKEEY